jgi:hypothetical protein
MFQSFFLELGPFFWALIPPSDSCIFRSDGICIVLWLVSFAPFIVYVPQVSTLGSFSRCLSYIGIII